MPETSQKLWSALGGTSLGELSEQRIDDVARWGQLPAGAKTSRGEVLFPRLPENKSEEQ